MKKLLETLHLQLCCYEEADVEQLALLLCDTQTMRLWPQPFTLEKVKEWIQKAQQQYEAYGIGRLGIVEKPSGKLIGDCGISRGIYDGEECWDVGIIISYPYEGSGYAVEALKAVVEYAFNELKIDAIRVNTAVDNKVVCWLAGRFGMKELRRFINTRNRNLQYILYEMRAQEWLKRYGKK